jgi:hypothetical protein
MGLESFRGLEKGTKEGGTHFLRVSPPSGTIWLLRSAFRGLLLPALYNTELGADNTQFFFTRAEKQPIVYALA